MTTEPDRIPQVGGDWLVRVPDHTRDFVESRARQRQCADGTVVYAIGDPPNGLFQVISGEVRLYAYSATGRQILVLTAQKGHWFGELSVVDGGPRPHHAQCHGNVTLRHLPMHDIRQWARSDPALLGHIALIGCGHQRDALKFIGSILGKSGRARLAETLLAMLPPGQIGPDPVRLRISQEDLASRIGLTRQHLNHLLAELKEERILATSYGGVELQDLTRLAALAA